MLLTGHQVFQYMEMNGTNYHKVNQVGIDLSVKKIEIQTSDLKIGNA